MEMIKQLLAGFRGDLPHDSRTARAIDSGATAEEIARCASEEGLHALAGALFEVLEEQTAGTLPDADLHVAGALEERIREFRAQLPADSETARAIDRQASIEDISEAAQQEGLSSLAALLFEAEQEAARD
jgi:hypothetical protein